MRQSADITGWIMSEPSRTLWQPPAARECSIGYSKMSQSCVYRLCLQRVQMRQSAAIHGWIMTEPSSGNWQLHSVRKNLKKVGWLLIKRSLWKIDCFLWFCGFWSFLHICHQQIDDFWSHYDLQEDCNFNDRLYLSVRQISNKLQPKT